MPKFLKTYNALNKEPRDPDLPLDAELEESPEQFTGLTGTANDVNEYLTSKLYPLAMESRENRTPINLSERPDAPLRVLDSAGKIADIPGGIVRKGVYKGVTGLDKDEVSGKDLVNEFAPNASDTTKDVLGFGTELALDPTIAIGALGKPALKGLQQIGERGSLDLSKKNIPTRLNELGLYSKLEHTLQNKMPNVATPEQVASLLKNNAVKPEEIEWSKINEFLSDKTKINKEDLLNFVKENTINIKPVIRQENLPVNTELKKLLDERDKYWDKAANASDHNWDKLSSAAKDDIEYLKVRELQDKINILEQNHFDKNHPLFNEVKNKLGPDFYKIAIPSRQKLSIENKINKFRKENPEATIPDELYNNITSSQMGDNYKEKILSLPDLTNEYKHHQHFGRIKNPMAHTRTSDIIDENGKKHLLMEEIQSLLHQSGKHHGYTKNQIPLSEGGVSYNQGLGYTDPEFGVADAPFKKTWHELIGKTQLMDAIKNDYDNIGWVDSAVPISRNPGANPKFFEDLYDKKMVQFYKDIGKKYGVEPKKVSIPENSGFRQDYSFATEDPHKMWTMELTPEMKKELKEKGLPLFLAPLLFTNEKDEESKQDRFNKIKDQFM